MQKIKLIKWIVATLVAVILLDLLFGFAFKKYMEARSLPGDYEMTEHILRHFDDDIVVLGSSVALNSINTKTLQDSLHLKTYNGASNGQAFPFYLTMLKAIVAQKVPKKVILGLTTNNLTDTGVGVRYNFLAPYYGYNIADINERLNGDDKIERIFLKSNFYRLNRIWFRILLYNFVSVGIKSDNGFVAKPLPPMFPERISQTPPSKGISSERKSEVEEFFAICKDNDIDLTVVLTPRCIEPTSNPGIVSDQLKELCSHYGITFYDDSTMPPFDKQNDLFYDAMHININGSKIYTDTIISRLKR